MTIESARGAPTRVRPATPASRVFWTQSRRLLGRDWPVAFLFAGPLVILLFGLIGYPLFYALRLSMYNYIGVTNRGFVGLANYQRLWGDSQFVESVLHTVRFAVISVFFKFWIGLGAALLLHRQRRFRSVFTGLVLLPWIIPEVVAALTWRGLYDPVFGGINQLLLALGIVNKGIAWLGDYKLALPSVIAVNVWKGIPFFTIILLSGLKAIDATLYDAAAVDGANAFQRFRHITLPGLRYVLIVACLLSLIFTLNAFGLIYLLTGGGPGGATRLFSILAYEYAIGQQRYSLGVAVAMAVVPILLILIIILGRYMRGDQRGSAVDDERFGRFVQGLAAFGAFLMLGLRFGWPIALAATLAIVALGFATNNIQRGISILFLVSLLLLLFGFGGLVQGIVGGAGVLLGGALGIGAIFLLLGIPAAIVAAISLSLSSQRTTNSHAVVRQDVFLTRLKRYWGSGASWLLLASLLLFELFPFYWVIVTAFKTNEQMREFRSIFWPAPWTLEHFRFMLTQTQFTRWFTNSVQVALVSCVVSVIVGALGAYALVRLKWRGAGFLSTAILFTYLMPGALLFLPLYQIFTQLHLINSLQALMVAYPTFGLPFACWLLMGYYRSIPEELEEAALIDGCNYIQAFFRVILPLTLPALLTVGLFALTGAFSEFLFAYIFVTSESLRTLPVGLGLMVIGDIFPYGRMFAASIMMAVPVTIVYMLAQRFMVEGLTAGSVKG